MPNEEVPVYERLQPKECLIISKTKKELLYACNEDGKIVVKRIPLPEIEK